MGAIQLFRGSRRDSQMGFFPRADVDVETISACDATRRVDEDGRQPLLLWGRKADAQRSSSCSSRRRVNPSRTWTSNLTAPIARLAAKVSDIDDVVPFCIRPDQFRPVINSDQSAIWRLISPGSRLLRSHANFTAPRSITAKLSPSSQAKSRYCSTNTMAIVPRLRR